MANKDNAFGFQPVRKIGGGVPEGMPITIGTTLTVYKGQVLRDHTTSGGIKGLATTFVTAGGTAAIGWLRGIAGEYFDPNGTKTKMMVYSPSEHIFSVQCKYAATATAWTEASVLSMWFNVTAPDEGNTNSGYSICELCITGMSTTAVDHMCRCVGVDPRVDNDIALSNPTLLVRFNEALISEFALA